MDISILKKCIILSILVPTIYVSSCMNDNNSIGYIFPMSDLYLEYNKEAIEIYCIITNPSNEEYPSNNLYFTRNKENVTENVEIVNSTTILLRKEKPEKSADNYHCIYQNEIVCNIRVIVGEKPLFKNFNCESYNLENFTCSWLPQNNTIKTNYSINYSYGKSNVSFECTIQPKNKCIASSYHPLKKIYNFKIKASNILGKTMTNFTFDNFKYVKSGSPKNLKVISFNQRSIKIRWKNPETMIIFPLNYRIFYRCNFGMDNWKLSFYNVSNKLEEVEYNLTNLYPNQNCTIRVSLKCNYSDDRMWSNNSSLSYLTDSAAPQISPKINIGSFQIIKKYSDMSDVYIYWQQVPREMENGDNFHYKVKVLDTLSDYSREENVNNYVKFENLYNNKSYKVMIWSENNKGISESKSILTIPALAERPAEVVVKTNIIYKNGTFELKFQPPEQNMIISNYTIFWCKSLKRPPYQCNGFLNWTEIPSNQTSFIVPVKEINNMTWQFAISVNSENGSSGMFWVMCTLLEGTETIQNFKVIVVNSTSITVGWNINCYNKYNYILSYCPVNKNSGEDLEYHCVDAIQNITFVASRTNWTIYNLYQNTRYKLTLNILSNNLKVSDNYVLGKTREGAPSKPFGLKQIFVTNSSIAIKWNEPTSKNGIISHYKLKINNITLINTSNNNHTLQHTFYNLTSYYNYTISISACTEICSEQSDNITVLTKIGVPGEVNKLRILAQKESFILFDWNKPDLTRGKIDYYEVNITTGNDVYLENVTECNYNRSCDLKMFRISVRAVNIDGDKLFYGPPSLDLECFCEKNVIATIATIVLFALVSSITIIFFFLRFYTFCQFCVVLKPEDIILPGNLKNSTYLENIQSFAPIVHDVREVDLSNINESLCTQLSSLKPTRELDPLFTESISTNEPTYLRSENEISAICSVESENNINFVSEDATNLTEISNLLEFNDKLKIEVDSEAKPYLKITELPTPKSEEEKITHYVMVGKN